MARGTALAALLALWLVPEAARAERWTVTPDEGVTVTWPEHGLRADTLGWLALSGYIYDASRDAGADAPGVIGGGATHAWVQIYLPGAGWTHFDPTNALTSDAALIPVAIVREPAQASPVSGTWKGRPRDALGLEVEVTVTSKDGTPAVRDTV